jgi:hypothetical protein
LVLDRTEFGVVAELIADAPLEQTLEGVRVEVAVAT